MSDEETVSTAANEEKNQDSDEEDSSEEEVESDNNNEVEMKKKKIKFNDSTKEKPVKRVNKGKEKRDKEDDVESHDEDGMVDSEDEVVQSDMTAQRRGIDVVFRDIRYNVKARLPIKDNIVKTVRREPKPMKEIIKGVSGRFERGRLYAIMGPSGAGKTTLLSILADRIKNGKGGAQSTGEILFNGFKKSQLQNGVRSAVAFVMQDDVLLGNLTPREMLRFTAMLRLGREVSHKEKYAKVEALMKSLNLIKCADTRVGTPGLKRGVSGGERKRTSIGMELITDPEMLFLDEPTTGLDSTMALSLVQILARLAHEQGKTIIATIHQPSSEIFYQFDDLFLLSEGNLVYGGPVKDSVSHFRRLGLPVPKYTNPSDHFMNVASPTWVDRITWKKSINQDTSENEGSSSFERLDATDLDEAQKTAVIREEYEKDLATMVKGYEDYFAERYPDEQAKIAKSKAKKPKIKLDSVVGSAKNKLKSAVPFNLNKKEMDPEKAIFERKEKPHFVWTQFFILLWRQFLQTSREPKATIIPFVATLITAIVIGLIFLQMGTDQQSVFNREGAIFIIIMNQFFASSQGTLVTFPLERPLFLREYSNRMYGVIPYFLAKSLVDIPGLIIFPGMLAVIDYWMIGLQTDAGKFFIWLAFVLGMASLGQALGFMLSSGLDLAVALPLLPLISIPLALVGGFFINPESTPAWLVWLQKISPFYWAFTALALNEFDGLHFHCKYTEQNIKNDPTSCTYVDGQQAIQLLGAEKYHIWECAVILIGFYIFMRLMACFLLWTIVKRKSAV